MGSASTKFRKHLQTGDEYAALHLYNNSSDLRKGLDPNISYGDHYNHETPLHYAAKHGMKSLLRIFLNELQGNPNKKNSRNETSLHCVCMAMNGQNFSVQQRRLECLMLILQWKGATLKDGEVEKADLGGQDEKQNTALHYAAASGLKKSVELLVSQGAPLFTENEQKQTPCDCAEKNNHSNIALYLESKMVFSNESEDEQQEETDDMNQLIDTMEDYCGLRAQDLQEAKDQLLVETSDMLRVPLFTAEALLRNHEWSREMLLEAWMGDPIACCEKCGVTPPPNLFEDRPMAGPPQSVDHDLTTPTYASAPADAVCDICAGLIGHSEEELVPMQCDHAFCRGCWNRYLTGKIQEGDTHNIGCPAYQCHKLVPVEVIETIVSRDMARRYLQFDIKAFVDSNPNIKWCPYPGCGRAVKLPEAEASTPTTPKPRDLTETSHAVDCGNGHYFCWECLGEAHEPVNCDSWKDWFTKISEIKPEELDGTADTSESAANCLWLVTNSKPCPQCKSPIQKNEGCNHMKCSKCKSDFCWVCLEPWKKHSSATGGYFRCNRYEVVKKVEENTENLKSDAERNNKKAQEMNRFVHYYTRFKNHENSYKLEEPLITTAKEKMMVLAKAITDPDTANIETKFVEEGVVQLLKARRVLKCSYAYGYFLEDTGYKKPIFEFMQTELEECTESLSEMIARPYLRTPRAKIIQTAHTVQRKRHEFVQAIAKGLVPADNSPYRKRKTRFSIDLDDDLKKALIESLKDLDPHNPWIKDPTGRHTNVAALLDWPEESDDSDTEVSPVPIATSTSNLSSSPPPPTNNNSGICARGGCMRQKAQNPRTGTLHDHCSLRCMRLDRIEKQELKKEGGVQPTREFVTDYQIDLLRALEMSRLQFIRDDQTVAASGRRPDTPPGNSPVSSTQDIPSSSQKDDVTSPDISDVVKSRHEGGVVKRAVLENLEDFDREFNRALEMSREEDNDLTMAIRLSLQDSGEDDLVAGRQRRVPSREELPMISSVVAKVPNKSVEDIHEASSHGDSRVRSTSVGSRSRSGTMGSEFELLGATGGAAPRAPISPKVRFSDDETTEDQGDCLFPQADISKTIEHTLNSVNSSPFGLIKDINVSNIFVKDTDKTKNFEQKYFLYNNKKEDGIFEPRLLDSSNASNAHENDLGLPSVGNSRRGRSREEPSINPQFSSIVMKCPNSVSVLDTVSRSPSELGSSFSLDSTVSKSSKRETGRTGSFSSLQGSSRSGRSSLQSDATAMCQSDPLRHDNTALGPDHTGLGPAAPIDVWIKQTTEQVNQQAQQTQQQRVDDTLDTALHNLTTLSNELNYTQSRVRDTSSSQSSSQPDTVELAHMTSSGSEVTGDTRSWSSESNEHGQEQSNNSSGNSTSKGDAVFV